MKETKYKLFIDHFVFFPPVPPADVKLRQISSKLISGQQSQFECVSSGSRPPAELQLFKGGKPLDSPVGGVQMQEDRSVLRVSTILTNADHQRTLTCRAANPKLQRAEQMLEHNIQLDVQCKSVCVCVCGRGQVYTQIQSSCVHLLCDLSLSFFEYGLVNGFHSSFTQDPPPLFACL